ncbi:hypothetical protein, partial [Klebsiella variicola]|uniref:hypothetical protein n=1 Tax=Klebsiella variicola TaxID=244366 RepID=UPI002731CDE1
MGKSGSVGGTGRLAWPKHDFLASFHATGNSSIFGYSAMNKRILLRRILHKTHELPSPHPVDVAAAGVRGRRAA